MNDLLKALAELSLSANEANVYLNLLQLGAVNAGPIVKNSALHRQFVYNALEGLEQKGLLTTKIQRNKKVFCASDPTALLKYHQSKEKLARAILPSLQKLRLSEKEQVEIKVLYGREEFIKNLFSVVEVAAQSDRIVRIIGGAPDSVFYELVGDQYGEYLEICHKFSVKKQMIAPSSTTKKFLERFAKEKGNSLKLLDAGLSSPSYTRITKDLTTIELYSNQPIIIQIHSTVVAAGYIDHFNLLWSAAKKK